jgi:hypothetical protein
MPLLLGLKQLPAGAQSLLGWQVLLCGSNEAVGTVVQVGAACVARKRYIMLKSCLLKALSGSAAQVFDVSTSKT